MKVRVLATSPDLFACASVANAQDVVAMPAVTGPTTAITSAPTISAGVR